jgi:hypothetical protein
VGSVYRFCRTAEDKQRQPRSLRWATLPSKPAGPNGFDRLGQKSRPRRRTALLRRARFLEREVDDESVPDVALHDAIEGGIDFGRCDDFDVADDVVLAAEVEHFLGLGDAAD